MSPRRPSPGFVATVCKQGVGQPTRCVAAAQPACGSPPGGQDAHGRAVALEIDGGARLQAELVTDGLRDDDLSLGSDALSHSRSITLAAIAAELHK
jgi:hypothetical protein